MNHLTKRDLLIGIGVGIVFYLLIILPLLNVLNLIGNIGEESLVVYFREI